MTSTGDVLVADTGNNLIRRISATEVVSTVAGSGFPGTTGGIGTAAAFSQPSFLAVGANRNIYVSDRGSHAAGKITRAGAATTIAQFSAPADPADITVGLDGTLYLTDVGTSLIPRIVAE